MRKDGHTARILAVLFLALAAACATSCNKTPAGNAQTETQSAKHYQLKGKVVSVDTRADMVNVASEAIPGFMDAMTMPYKVKPESELQKLHTGDSITADLVVQDDGGWLQNINVTGHSASAK